MPVSSLPAGLRTRILVSAFAALMVACAPTEFYANPNHPRGALEGKTLYVMPISGAMVQNNLLNHFRDDFKAGAEIDDKIILADSFNIIFARQIKRYARKITVIDTPHIKYGEEVLTANQILGEHEHSRRLDFEVPKQEDLLKQNVRADFILMTQELVFDTESRTMSHVGAPHLISTPGGPMMMGGGTTSSQSKSINLGIQYLIWDYARKEIAVIGYANGSASANWFITKSDWIDIMRGAAENVMSRPPFSAPSSSTSNSMTTSY